MSAARAGTAPGTRIAGASTTRRSTSIVTSSPGSASIASHRRATSSSASTTGTRPFFVQLLRKMSLKFGGDHGLEAVVLQGPDSVLPRRADAEAEMLVGEPLVVERAVRGRHATPRTVRHRTRCAFDPLQPLGRDDLIGVDVGSAQRQRGPGQNARPASQVLRRCEVASHRGGGGDGGETRWVRPPLPWRPSKLRLDVLAGPLAASLVGVHGEAHRAAVRASRRRRRGRSHRDPPPRPAPSPRAPRHDHRPLHADLPAVEHLVPRPRSSMRLFVHDPMKTVSTGISRIGVPAVRPM